MTPIVRQVASIALHASFNDQELDALTASFDIGRLRAQVHALGMCDADASDLQIARLYFSRRCSAISPNAFFDEAWYLQQNADVRQAIRETGLTSGFVHFIKRGFHETRWPNPTMAATAEALPEGP